MTINNTLYRILNSFTARILFCVYYFWILLWMVVFGITSSADAEWLIDGNEILDICQALRAYSENDDRKELAIVSFLPIIPTLVYIPFIHHNKSFRLLSILCVLIFLLIWGICFIYPYRNCPIF